jgi:hypothetical protein
MHWLFAVHGVGTQILRESQVQPAPQSPDLPPQLQVGTHMPLRRSQKPPLHSLSALHVEPDDCASTHVERESQTIPAPHLAVVSQKLLVLQVVPAQYAPAVQSQSVRQVWLPFLVVGEQLHRSHW